MALAIVLVLIAVAAVVFQFWSPWWLTPIASNWKLMDDTLWITLVITGVVFVAINVFIAYAVVKFRNRPGHKAAYEPHNTKLEWWLTGVTSAGVVAMLAPGLWAYADLIDAPDDAMVVEVLGRQWQWRYRFPGADGHLGVTDVRFVSGANPFGINPDDPRGKDDVLVEGSEVHLPLDKPIRVVQRSLDVLHNFYVPQIRVKMDMVPGLVSTFWFRPTREGTFEVLCAEFCGISHFNMRGHVVVEDEAKFASWLGAQPTYAQAVAKAAAPAAATAGPELVAQGQQLAQSRGCLACHSLDGKPGVGPTWKGLFGKSEKLVDGSSVTVDDAYLKKSMNEPNAQVVAGFQPVMPPSGLSDAEMAAVIAFIKEQK
jgi:cytochrome c oxidase subunit 2